MKSTDLQYPCSFIIFRVHESEMDVVNFVNFTMFAS